MSVLRCILVLLALSMPQMSFAVDDSRFTIFGEKLADPESETSSGRIFPRIPGVQDEDTQVSGYRVYENPGQSGSPQVGVILTRYSRDGSLLRANIYLKTSEGWEPFKLDHDPNVPGSDIKEDIERLKNEYKKRNTPSNRQDTSGATLGGSPRVEDLTADPGGDFLQAPIPTVNQGVPTVTITELPSDGTAGSDGEAKCFGDAPCFNRQ